MRAVSTTRRQRGFTLIEMVVVLAIVGVSLFLAAALLQEAQTLITATGAELDSPLSGLATDRLRADLQAAAAVGAPSLDWSSGPLLLAPGPAGGPTVVYTREGKALVRRLLDADGTESGYEVWIRSLAEWRWRSPGLQMVEVDLSYHRAASASRWRLDGRPGRPARELAIEHLVLALRGGSRGSGW